MVANQLNEIHQSIQSDPALRARLDKVSDQKSYAALVTEVGKSRGYNFTEQDVTSALKSASSTKGDERELSKEQLESMAGGSICSFSRWWYARFTSGEVAC